MKDFKDPFNCKFEKLKIKIEFSINDYKKKKNAISIKNYEFFFFFLDFTIISLEFAPKRKKFS